MGGLLLRQTDACCENSLGKSREPSLKLRPQRSKEIVAEQLCLTFCSGHCASLKVLLPGLGKPYFHFTLPTFCPYLVEVCTGRSVCLCVSVALFVLQSKKLSNLVLSLSIQPHYIHIRTVNLQVCIHVAIQTDTDSTVVVHPLA